jgi:hypothetical protein
MKTTATLLLLQMRSFPLWKFFSYCSSALKSRYRFTAILYFVLHCTLQSRADFTIAAGTTVRADTLQGYSGVLRVNGTLNITRNTVLSRFTKVVLNAPSGQIYWSNNSDLTFSSGTDISINQAAPGLRPTGGNSSQRLWIGTTLIAVSNDNSGPAALTFADMNEAGGLPAFSLSVSATAVCFGNVLTATLVPLNTSITYDCNLSIDNGAALSAARVSNFNTSKVFTITPPNAAASKVYTLSCTLYKSGDGNAIETKTISVTVNPTPAEPTAAAVFPLAICQGNSATFKAISAGNSIEWFTAATGGTAIGTSASGVDYTFSPAMDNSYYAGTLIPSTGCRSTTRAAAGTVTVSQPSAGGNTSGNATVCRGANSNSIIISNYTGAITKWQSSEDNFATATDILVSNDNLVTSNIRNTTSYRAVIKSGVCPATVSTVTALTVYNAGRWLGVNTNWNDGANWCNGEVPASTANISIDSGLLFYPEVNSTIAVNNISIAQGARLKLTAFGKLSINGAIQSMEGIDASEGSIELTGITPQTIHPANFVNSTIATLIVSNSYGHAAPDNPSVSVAGDGGMLKITNKVSFGNINHAILQTNDLLTLVSDAQRTASIADLTNNNSNSNNIVAGKVVIERFISARRAWRFLTAPITPASNVSISASWQEGARVTDPAASTATTNPAPGYGTHVSFGFPLANPGYDLNINGNTSIKYFTASGSNGVPFTTDAPITEQPAYLLFVRGDRSTQLSLGTSVNATPTVLRVKGLINNGPTKVMLPVSYKSGSSNFRVFRNPYPAAISFNKIMQDAANQAAGFPNSFYVWDPTLGGKTGTGGWVALSYNSTTRQYDKSVASDVDASGAIQSGSAVLIDYNGNASGVAVTEADKTDGSNNSTYRTGGQLKSIRTTLNGIDTNGSPYLIDAAMATFDDQNSNEFDGKDMGKIENFEESFSLITEGHILAIERRKPVAEADTIFYHMTNMKRQHYQLLIEMGALNLAQGTTVYLEDSYLESKTLINTDAPSQYDFDIDRSPLSAVSDRFRLVFNNLGSLNKDREQSAEINDNIGKPVFRVFPNPVATDAVHLQISDGIVGSYLIRLTNTAGETVAVKTIGYGGGKAVYAIEPSRNLANGNYHFQIIGPDKTLHHVKVLVQKK